MNLRQPAETDSTSCPPREQLLDWLNGDIQLSPGEIDHISMCERCTELLEEISDAPELAGVSSETAVPEIFEHEPEYQALKGRLSELSGVSSRHPSNQRLVTTEVARVQPGDVVDARHLRMLQQQVSSEQYRLQRVLGTGGSGTVVLAYDQLRACDVAIKFLLRDGPVERQRFEREAKILGEMDHPNIVRIFEVGTNAHPSPVPANPVPAKSGTGQSARVGTAGSLYLVMEYVSGGSGADLQRRLASDFFSLARMLIHVAHGLHSAHLQGLVHRDVKPSNLLFDIKSNAWKVADFGLAKSESSDSAVLTHSGDILGTPAFMSPEQVHADQLPTRQSAAANSLSKSTDIYSLGATMYALLTGQAPLRGSMAAILRQIPEVEPVKPTVLNPKIPVELETICLHAMEKSPSNRYPDMQALADDLERFLQGRPIVARPLSSLGRLRRWSARNGALAFALGVIAVLVAVLSVGSVVAAGTLWRQKRQLLAQRQENLQQLCSKVATADPGALPLAITQLANDRAALLPYLEESWVRAVEPRARLNLACALAVLGAGHEEFLVEQAGATITSPGQCLAICDALSTRRTKSLELIRQRLAADMDAEQRDKLAIVALQLQDDVAFRDLAASDPDSRTALIHLMPSWHGDLSQLIAQLETMSDADAVSALSLGLGLVDRLEFSSQQLHDLQRVALRLELESSDTGLRSAAYWLKRQLLWETRTAQQHPDGMEDFWRNPASLAANTMFGFRMLEIPAGKFTMGSGDSMIRYGGRTQHPVTLSRNFWLADREVTVGLFQAYMDDEESASPNQDGSRWQPDLTVSPTPSHPAQQLTWFQAVKFCNWLSELHGFDPYYEAAAPVSFNRAEGQELLVENWVGRPSATGYRLPTEAEFEYACRAGTQTLYSFGDEMRFFEYYAAWSNNTTIRAAACGSLMPNPWGLFEMHGNVWEWCEDWYHDFDSEAAVQDPLYMKPSPQGRCFRGGGICTFTGYPDSSSRGGALPGRSFNNVGFRLARNAE